MEIIYEDRELVVCHKMSGVPVQTADIRQQDMVSILKNYLVAKKEKAEIFVVHRLDQPVEGVIVFAKTKRAASALSCQIQKNNMKKYYLALVEGKFTTSVGVLEDYLVRDGKSNISKVVPKSTRGAKAAKLFYKVKQEVIEPEKIAEVIGNNKSSAQLQQISLVNVRLETGRHHQIRVQMAHAGHPLIGDKKYNPNCSITYMPVGLCANEISFSHPITGKEIKFVITPKGELFQKFI